MNQVTNSAVRLVPNPEQQRYQIVAQLGQGGMSLVHLAAVRGAHGIRKLVVLKSMRPELLQDKKMLRMFLDEGRRATLLNHSNIVQSYEVATIATRPVIVMEYMEGQALSKIIKYAQLSSPAHEWTLALHLRVLQDSLTGLDYAHNLVDFAGKSLGLVHRDVSPQNVFVTYDGHVKILDFGIAKAVDGSHRTEVGEIKGKIRYMAPEQMQGAPDIDARADIFSVGAMLWEALAGTRLWQGVPDTKVIQSVMTGGVPSPSSVRSVNPELERICMKALAQDREHRYASASQMQADLEQVADALNLRASHKDLGQVTLGLFSEERKKVRQALEAKLASQEPAIYELPSDDDTMELLSASGSGSGPASTTATVEERATIKPQRRLGVGWIAFGCVAAACVALVAFTRSPGVVASAGKLQAESAPAAAPVKADDFVRVHFSATPASARLFLDGALLPANPYAGNVHADAAPHSLKATADGFEAQTVAVSLTVANDISLKLEPAVKDEAKISGRAARPRPVQHPLVKGEAPNCAFPFIVDSSNIRRVRPECM